MRFVSHSQVLGKKLFNIWKEPLFILITIWGHAWIFIGSWIFFKAEYGLNPHVQNFLDALYWAMQTVTTVGYGDVTPMTTVGKIDAIFMMAFGSLFLWTYASLFVSIILSARVDEVAEEISAEIEQLKKE